MNGMALTLCMIAIVVSIVAGFKWGINTGIMAACFAFFISIFFMGGSVNTVIGYWPDSIVFFILSIALFFTYATQNGTMDAFSKRLLYLIDGRAALVPWVIYIVTFLITFSGAGMSAMSIIAPLAFPLSEAAGISPLVCAFSIICGSVAAVFNIFTGQMSVNRTYIMDLGWSSEEAYGMAAGIWVMQIVIFTSIVLVAYIVTRSYKAKKVAVEKPEPFTPVQKRTLILVLSMCALMVVPLVLSTLIPSSKALQVLSRYAQPQSVMMIGALLAILAKLGDPKKVLSSLPMNTVIMIAGFSMLMNVAKDAGLVEAMGEFLGNNIPVFLLRTTFVLIGAFLSFFASGSGVVWPLMFPLVPVIAASTGINPGTLFACISAGTATSGCSPFSTGGALTLAGCTNQEQQDKLSKLLIIAALLCPILAMIFSVVGLMDFVQIF